jgi:drug/metabolite transporter (DMT)-like permease
MSPGIIASLAATWLIWGSTYLAIQWALVSFPPFWQIGVRFVIAGALLLLFMRWRGSPWPTLLQWRNALIVGSLLLAGGTGMTAYAEQTIQQGLIVTFLALIPAIIALLNLAYGVRPGRIEVVGIAVGIGGVVMLTHGSAFSSSLVGLVAISVASCSWSLGSVLSQRQFPLAKGAMGYASEMLAGGVVLTVMSLLRHEVVQWPPQPLALASWIYLITFGSWIAFSAYMYLLDHASAGLASSYTLVNPVIAMLLGVSLNHERVSSFEWLAVAVILVGVMLLIYGRKRT